MSDGLVVGTYLAEQVAVTSYVLLSVPLAESAAPAPPVPFVAGNKLRKRRLRNDHSNFKADVLPALALDPLLNRKTGQAEKQAQRRQRLNQIEISSARLAEGRRTWTPQRDATAPPPSRGDSKAVACLTAPLPWFRLQDSEFKPRKKGMRATDPWELFDKSLRGTGVEHSPKARSRWTPHSNRDEHDLFKLSLTEQPLLPEDAVEAYFESQQSRTSQRKTSEAVVEKKGTVAAENMEVKKHASLKSRRAPVTSRVSMRDSPRQESVRRSRNSTEASEEFEGGRNRHIGPDLLDQMFVKQKMSPLRRDACQLLRMFVFGAVGNENCKNRRERENVFFESCGTKDDMLKLLQAWDKVDTNDSGRIDMGELQRLADRLMIDVAAAFAWQENIGISGANMDKLSGCRMPAWIENTSVEERVRFVHKLCERLTAVLSTARKSSFCLEDLMRLIWSCSSEEDLRQMRSWCEEINHTRDKWRVSPPPVLPEEEKAALQAVFNFFDKDSGGTVTANELIMSGLIDKDYAKSFIRQVDTDGSGEIDIVEFCELMCPHGFRATEKSVVGSTCLGQAARYNVDTKTWRLTEAPQEVRTQHRRSKLG
ncbi:unnamed protein product [Effrenium voratum]|uniref:EF-hand domain-containing protein n=1 Tax=Effrenium voratum TaxID=2562239 RepID=A0AA36JE95_9DINO|nr:unnamed protein product [Effrenium voratum]CAJ1433417.1 unnamed protein product [Effrenium voratum]